MPPAEGTRLSLRSVVAGLSTALDLAFVEIAEHHARVAFTALHLGQSMGLDAEALLGLYLTASLHDLGAIDSPDRRDLGQFDLAHPDEHCRRGAAFLEESVILADLAPVVASHHDDWAGGNASGLRQAEIPLGSRLIHLADRVDVLCDRARPALEQRDTIRRRIRAASGRSFDPAAVEAFGDVSGSPQFWVDYGARHLPDVLEELAAGCGDRLLPSDAISPLAGMFSRIIDSRSRYTGEHSSLVARVAGSLARSAGLGAAEQSDLVVAALLHDVGKLGVPESLLLKAGPLTSEEQDRMKQHAWQTDRVLRRIRGIGHIRPFASFHHERLDGLGYPFQLDRDSLPLGSQLLSVCDQFAALARNRPYRAALDREEAGRVLGRAAGEGALNGDLVDLLVEHYREAELPAPAPSSLTAPRLRSDNPPASPRWRNW